MSGIEEVRKKLALPPISQVGVVVRNMEEAVKFYSSAFGVGPFTVYEFVPDKFWHMEEPAYQKNVMGKAQWGDIELELIQPLEGKSIHKEFLDVHGEGIQHLGFNVPNYDEMFNQFIKEGFKPMLRAESFVPTYNGYLKACYFDTRKVGGILVEIIWKSWLMEKK